MALCLTGVLVTKGSWAAVFNTAISPILLVATTRRGYLWFSFKVVLIVSACIVLYQSYYILGDGRGVYFIVLLLAFIFSMGVLVTRGSKLVLLLG